MKNTKSKILILGILVVALVGIFMSKGFSQKNVSNSANWPPQIGQAYPDLELIDQDGKQWNLSRFKGKVIIVEPIGMNCPACQSFAGAHIKGSYGNITPQAGLDDFEGYFNSYTGGLSLDDDGIVLVELLLYDLTLGRPTLKDAKGWAKHFGMKSANNHFVVIPATDMRNKASYDLIPGYQLIGKNFKLRSDSTGHHPRDDLWRTLLPMVPKVLMEKGKGAA
jgi:hypothetical protein